MPSLDSSAWRTGQATGRCILEGHAAAARAGRGAARARRGLVILDEPTSALDPVGRADVRTIVRRAADAGSTIFLNSHLLTEVERVCDRVAIVDHGRVLASGRIDDLLGESSVRVRVTDLAAADVAELRRFGRVAAGEDGWLTVGGTRPERVPDRGRGDRRRRRAGARRGVG